jgi:hypothetical protein
MNQGFKVIRHTGFLKLKGSWVSKSKRMKVLRFENLGIPISGFQVSKFCSF